MSDEVRKPPREFNLKWDRLDGCFYRGHVHKNKIVQPVEDLRDGEILIVQEILPGDDSIRVSRETIAMILETLDHAKQVPNMSQADISFLTRRHAAIIERIERESKGE